MKVQNLMESIVEERVRKMYAQLNEDKPAWLMCDCEDCQLDVASYVLNRVKPFYIVSGRGIIHAENSPDRTQIRADIDSLIIEGIRKINTVPRPYHKKTGRTAVEKRPAFNFPVFLGKVYDGQTFEPLADATITLNQGGAVSDMIDNTWSNPCKTYEATKGAYSFWVRPVDADDSGEHKSFSFDVEAKRDGYTPAGCAFTVPLTSDAEKKKEIGSQYSLRIQDLYLFREGVENSLE